MWTDASARVPAFAGMDGGGEGREPFQLSPKLARELLDETDSHT